MALTVSHLEKKYANKIVLDDLTFQIKKGSFVSIFGPNGSGKTTLLHLLSGLDTEYTGAIRFCAEDMQKGFVFQNASDSLLPWKNVIDNLILDKQNISDEKITKVLTALNLEHVKNNFAYQLSGGMKQLLAIARPFVFGCNLLFLDEPFSSLDMSMAKIAREKLIDLWQIEKPTVFFVSHDIDEAILLSDKVILLDKKKAGIKKIVSIQLKRPRKQSLVFSQKFLQYKRKILQELAYETA